MIDPGSVAIGALCIIALLAGFVGWCTRGHRLDLRGVRVIRSDEWTPPSVYYSDKKPEDFFEMAKERDPE